MSDMLDSMSADAKSKEEKKNEKRILDAALKTAGPDKEWDKSQILKKLILIFI